MKHAVATGLVLALAVCCGSCHRRPPSAAVPAGAPSVTPAQVDRSSAPALDLGCAQYALERTGRPVIGFAPAVREVPQSPLSPDEQESLGDAATEVSALSLPDIGGMTPVRVHWTALADAESSGPAAPEAEWLWTFRFEGDKYYLSPWLEVLGAGTEVVRSEEPASHEEVLSSGFALLGRDAGEGAEMAIGAADGKEWGVPGRDVAAALRACLLAKLGKTEESAKAAAQAGAAGFARLPACLTYLAHRSAIEGIAGGWPRAVALRTIEKGLEFGVDDYAGKAMLLRDREVLAAMVTEDRNPPGDPSKAKPGEPQWARYQIRRLCDAGAPEVLDRDAGAGDPTTRLLNGGPAATEALAQALDDDRMTRMLAGDATGPLPDLLRVGDVAFDILAGPKDRELLSDRGVSRLYGLPTEERREAILSVRRSVNPGAPG